MNKIDKLLQEKRNNILSIYFTAGYPQLNDTNTIIEALKKTGTDLIEIGIPFSDPVADGPTIQKSSNKALINGMTLDLLFKQLIQVKQSRIPKILMGYFNPILQFGVDEFLVNCKKTGVDGAIIPDLPIDLFSEKYQNKFNNYGIHFIPLVTPQTSRARMNIISKVAKGFVYVLSQNSITGSKVNLESKKEYYEKVNKTIPNPTLIGFGIQNITDFEQACGYGNGAIIGSSFIKSISNSDNLHSNISNFIKQFKKSKS